jgi:O-antigen/teichoic acid export membrane protein
MSLLRKLAGETAIYGISSILSRLLNYVILTPYFTRIFLREEYGEISILFTYAAILMVVFTYRMETAFFRFGSREDGIDRAFTTASVSLVVSTLGLFLLGWLFLEPIAAWVNYESNPWYILLVVGIIALDALAAIPYARLRLENRPIRFAIAKTLHIVVNILFILFFLELLPSWSETSVPAWMDWYRSEDRVAYVFVANLLASAVLVAFLSPAYWRVKWVFDRQLWRKMLVYAGPLVIVGLAAVINQLIALPLMENLLPGTLEENRAQTGVYSAAAKIAVLMNLFIQAFNYAAEPFFFNNATRDNAKTIYADVGRAFALVGSTVFLGILLYLDLVQFILGADYRAGLGVVPLLLLAYFFLGLYYNFSIWYKLADKTKIGAYISVGGVLITLLLNVLLIPLLGYYGAAIGALACYAFMALASYWTGRRYYPVPYATIKIGGYIGLAIGCYLLSLLPSWLDWKWGIVVQLLYNTLCLLVFAFLVWRFDGRDIRRLLSRNPHEVN